MHYKHSQNLFNNVLKCLTIFFFKILTQYLSSRLVLIVTLFLTKWLETFCTQMEVSNGKAINTVQYLLDDLTTLEFFFAQNCSLKENEA